MANLPTSLQLCKTQVHTSNFFENVLTVKQISLIQLMEQYESIAQPVSEPSYLCLVTSCAWSMLFTLAQHAIFSPSFSSPSLKQLLPIHLFSKGSFSWAACLNSLYIIRNAWKINVYCMKTCINFTKCIFPSFVAFFCIYLETSE